MRMAAMPDLKPVVWIGSSKADLSAFPEEVKDSMGFALYVAQLSGKHHSAKPLRGFGGAGILEVVDEHESGTYRVVYAVQFPGRIYVLHAFQKKSKTGIKTPKAEISLIRSRLKSAGQEHGAWLKRQKGTVHDGEENRRSGR
jgi:phage-related protein